MGAQHQNPPCHMTVPKITSFRLFVLASCLTLLFYLSLHPASDFVGGIVFLLVGGALPSLIVVALALALAWLLPTTRFVRFLTKIALTVPIGLNSSLPDVVGSPGYRAEVSSDIRGRVVLANADPSKSVDVKYSNWGAFFVHPAKARVELGGDEGCGCFYFLDAKTNLYSDLIIEKLFATVMRRGALVKYDALDDPSQERRDVHLELSFWQEASSYRSLVEVVDRGIKIAAFAHTNIPLRAYVEPIGVGRGNFDKNFWQNATDILLHSNLWTWLADQILPNYFPDREFERFIVGVVSPLK